MITGIFLGAGLILRGEMGVVRGLSTAAALWAAAAMAIPVGAGTGRRDPPAAQGEGRDCGAARALPILTPPAASRYHLVVVP